MKPRYLLFTALLILGLSASAQAADPALQIIHNSPSAGATVVDIYLNEGAAPAVEDLGFREATGIVILPAGDYTIGIAPGNSTGPEDIIASFGPVNLAEDTETLVMAAGELGDDFNLFFNEWIVSAPAGEVGILAFHGSPDAPTVDIAAVGVGVLFDSLPYLGFDGYLNVPENDYTLTVAPEDESPIAAFSAPLTGLGGGAAVVFASGYLGADPAFGLFAALPDGTVLELPAAVSTSNSTWSEVKAGYR